MNAAREFTHGSCAHNDLTDEDEAIINRGPVEWWKISDGDARDAKIMRDRTCVEASEQPFTREDAARLSELEDMEAGRFPLSAEEYAELRDLLNRENAAFVRGFSGGAER